MLLQFSKCDTTLKLTFKNNYNKFLIRLILYSISVFAMPPTNVEIETKVIMDGGKILETTINWKADEKGVQKHQI